MHGDAAELHRWAVAVAAVAAHAVSGYVWQQRKHKTKKKRWACYQKLLTTYSLPLTSLLFTMSRWAYYQKLSGTLTLFKVDKRTGAPDWGGLRGTAAAEHAVRRRALAGLPFVFAVFCHSDKMFELSVRDEADLNRWLEILPTFVAVDAVAGLGGGSHVISKLTKARTRPRPPPRPPPRPRSRPRYLPPLPWPWPSPAPALCPPHITSPSPTPSPLPQPPPPLPPFPLADALSLRGRRGGGISQGPQPAEPRG